MVRSPRHLVAGLAAAVLAAAAAFSTPVGAGEHTPTEYEVKAAYLFNFARFVEWPSEAFTTAREPFAICVVGSDPFGSVLDTILAGESVAGRSVIARRITLPADARGCQILFASGAERGPAIVDAVDGRPILTVGDEEAFARRGGMVSFRREQNTVRFDVNPEAVRRSGLKMSSQLLNLARIVPTEP